MLDAAIAYALVTQHQTNFTGPGFHPLLYCSFTINLNQKVHTTAQIQTQIHRAGAYLAQPVRCGWRQIQRHYVVTTERLFSNDLAAQLIVVACHSHQPGRPHLLACAVADISLLQRLVQLFPCRQRHLTACFSAGYLNRRNIRVKIGHGIQAADAEHGDQQKQFPARVVSHRGSLPTGAVHTRPSRIIRCFLWCLSATWRRSRASAP